MIIYIVRHAWAGHFGDPQWPDDFLRPLSADGTVRFTQFVRTLAERDFAPKIAACSSLVRCRQTAEVIAQGVAGCGSVVELDALQPGSNLEALLAWTEAQAGTHDEVAWVGHAPDVGQLTAALIGQPDGWIRFAKGAVAAIRMDGSLEAGQGELRWLATAKLLGC